MFNPLFLFLLKMYRRLANNRTQYDLTIIILSLPNRLEQLQGLITELKRQSANKSVQIVYVGDNKTMTVGKKRNLALTMADGNYVCFIDDDDWVSEDYVSSIVEAIEGNPDVITFHVQKYKNGVKGKQQRYYKDASRPYLAPDRTHYKLAPNHLCAWKKEVIKESFPNKSLCEDHEWAEMMTRHVNNIHQIDKVLYHYYYDTDLSETHKR